MSEAQKRLRDRMIRRWMDRHEVYGGAFDNGYTSGEERNEDVRWLYTGNIRGEMWVYTTERMFDGRFWTFAYRMRKRDGAMVLLRGSLRRHAKRKDAKARVVAESRRLRGGVA